MILNTGRTDQYRIGKWTTFPGVYVNAVVPEVPVIRVPEKDIYNAIMTRAQAELGSMTFHSPEQEPAVSALSAWCMIEMDLDDAPERNDEWAGSGVATMTISAQKAAGNIYKGRDVARQLSDAFVNQSATVTASQARNLGRGTIGTVRFLESESYPIGESDGLIKHGWAVNFQVFNDE